MSLYFIIFSTLLSVLIGFLAYIFSYWEFQGVKQLRKNIPFGSFFKLKSVHLTELLQEVYDEFKGKADLAGSYLFLQPFAIIINLDLVQSILIKDFNKFVNRINYSNEENDPLSGHLFLLYGEKWRVLRSKLSPTFTSGKMKFMFPTIVTVAKEFKTVLDAHLQKTPDAIEIYDFMARYTTDVIGTCAFGIECNSLKDPNTEFRRIGKRIFPSKKISIRWRLLKSNFGQYLKFFGIKRHPQEVQDFIINIVKETVETREREKIQRNDFIDILIELKNSKNEDGKPFLNIYQMAAQVLVFFAAGFETSSSNMTYGLYELAKNPSIQEKVQNEILKVLEKYNGELTYEAMMEMNYLDQVISETLRKYPGLSALTRIAGEDYNLPGTDVILKKGTTVYIPVKAIHYDPDIYEEPLEFRPERFEPEEVQKRHPQAFLGFGDGPRNCIGLRFGRMQVRVGLITLLRSYRFSVCEKTPENLPISNYSFVLIPGCKVYLKVENL